MSRMTRTTRRPLRLLPGLPLALLLAACGVTPNWLELTPRPNAALPGQFEAPNAGPGAPTGCTSPLRDPVAGTTLTLLRSSAEGGRLIGDYTVEPTDRYGLAPREAVRVDCRLQRPLGVVPR